MLKTNYRMAEPKSSNWSDLLGPNQPLSLFRLTPSPIFSEKEGLVQAVKRGKTGTALTIVLNRVLLGG